MPPMGRMPRSPSLIVEQDLIATVQRKLTRIPLGQAIGWIQVGIDPTSNDPVAPISPQWLNEWESAGPPAPPVSFYMAPDGEVRFRGRLVGGIPGTVAFRLPEGYRPSHSEVFITPRLLAGYNVLQIDPNGDVTVLRISP